METPQPRNRTADGTSDPLADRAGVPVPPLARAAIADYQRRIAEADALLQAYLAGLVAGLGIPAERVERVDVGTWTIRLRAAPPDAADREDGHRRERATPSG